MYLAIINAAAQPARERFSAAATQTEFPLRQDAAGRWVVDDEAMREGLNKLSQRIAEMNRAMAAGR